MYMNEYAHYSYGEYIKLMYQKGYYVSPYYIDIMSDEVYCIENKIFIVPTYIEKEEDKIYVFTGISQKEMTISNPTEFILYLEDIEGREFRDEDNIMMSLVRGNDIKNLYTRNYATWKFGVEFDKGIHLDHDRCLIFQTQKEIGKFNIDIRNIDLFRYYKKIENKIDRMMWLE